MKRQSKALLMIGCGVSFCLALLVAGHWGGYRINLTPSYPVGLWRIEPLLKPVALGDLILICPPQTPAFELARNRGYLRSGLCPGWFSPLIKTVLALPDQNVFVDANVRVDGVLIPHSDTLNADGEGRPLQHYGGGRVPPGYLYLHSSFAGSYDSRYFGPVPRDGLLGLARSIFTWSP